ncbi:MAG: NAD(P)-dependent oxidoreductase [Spirochaetota bacterium]
MKQITPQKTVIGWIGTGVMGRWMCQHLIDNGYTAVVHNRTASKAKPLLDSGAQWADTPGEVARRAEVIFTIIGYPEDVERVYFGDNGVISAVQENSIVVDMTTTKPSLAENIAQACQNKGVEAIDAPVSGGDVGAREARLSIMAGGTKEAFDMVQPLFELMGTNIVYEGSAGKGQHTKMSNQITIAGTMIGMCEALLYSYKANLDMETMLSTISKGAAGCWSLDNLAPRIIQGNFDPGFQIDHFVKDMGIALEEAQNLDIALPGLALVHQFYLALQASGHGTNGTQALILALDRLSKAEVFS